MENIDNNIGCYIIEIDKKSFVNCNENDMQKHQNNVYATMKKIKDSNDKYGVISFIIGYSNINPRTAETTYIRTGKPGRPKKVINGSQVGTYGDIIGWHLHIYVFSNYGYISTYCNEVIEKLRKTSLNKVEMRKRNSDENAVKYIYNQCAHPFTCGDYFN